MALDSTLSVCDVYSDPPSLMIARARPAAPPDVEKADDPAPPLRPHLTGRRSTEPHPREPHQPQPRETPYLKPSQIATAPSNEHKQQLQTSSSSATLSELNS